MRRDDEVTSGGRRLALERGAPGSRTTSPGHGYARRLWTAMRSCARGGACGLGRLAVEAEERDEVAVLRGEARARLTSSCRGEGDLRDRRELVGRRRKAVGRRGTGLAGLVRRRRSPATR